MAPDRLMWLGAVGGVLIIGADWTGQDHLSLAMFAFFCGACFGKGYGLFEERTRPNTQTEQERP